MELKAFTLIMTGVVFEVVGQIGFKRGAATVVRESGEQGVLRYWRDLALERWIQFGIAVHLVALLIWIAVLSFVPLSIAFPLASLSYCGAAIGGHYWLGERLGRRAGVAIALITIGAALVSWPRG